MHSRRLGTILAHGPGGWGEGELRKLTCGQSLIPFLQVVLIPGLLLPAIIWKNVAPRLASHGFRVLLYGMQTQLDRHVALMN